MLAIWIRLSFRRLTLRGMGMVLVLALLTLPVCFALSDTTIASAPNSSKGPVSLLKVSPERLSPRLREIRERLVQERAQLEPLRAEYRKASDPDQAQKIAAQMSELKTQTEGDILAIQLKFARAEGKSERVEALEKMIAQRNAPVSEKSTEAPVRRHRQEGPR